jgi:hypothetical protein
MLHTVLRKATTNLGPFSRTCNKASRPSSSKIWKMNGFTMRNRQWWHLQYLMQIGTDGLMTQANPGHVVNTLRLMKSNSRNITLNNATSCTVLCVTKHRLWTFARRTFYASPFTKVIQFCCEQPMWQLNVYMSLLSSSVYTCMYITHPPNKKRCLTVVAVTDNTDKSPKFQQQFSGDHIRCHGI